MANGTYFTPEVGKTYENRNGFTYTIISANGTDAVVQRLSDGWRHTVVGVKMYDDGKIQWDFSRADGRFMPLDSIVKEEKLRKSVAILLEKAMNQLPETCQAAIDGRPLFFVGGGGIPVEAPAETETTRLVIQSVQKAIVYAIVSNDDETAYLFLDEATAEKYQMPDIGGVFKALKSCGLYHTVKAWVSGPAGSRTTVVTVKETPAGLALVNVGAPLPELGKYNEEHQFEAERNVGTEYKPADPDDFVDFEVIFDIGEERYYYYTQALNSSEALGMFFAAHPHVCFNDVVDVVEC